MEKFCNNHFIENDEVIEYFSNLLDALQKDPNRYRDVTNHCLSSNCFASNNLLHLINDDLFLKNINFLLKESQNYIPDKRFLKIMATVIGPTPPGCRRSRECGNRSPVSKSGTGISHYVRTVGR